MRNVDINFGKCKNTRKKNATYLSISQSFATFEYSPISYPHSNCISFYNNNHLP